MAHDTYIKYRGTKDEWQRIKDAAKDSGADASTLMRDAVMNRVKRIERQINRKPMGETEYLLSTKANAEQLMASIADLDKEQGETE